MPDVLEDPLLHGVTALSGHKILPPCVLLERIGEGGMGVVYRGIHLNLGIEVAVKIVPPSKSGGDATFVERFRREARSAARINHQNVVRVFDVATVSDLHYLIMEYVAGEDAQQRVVRKGALPVGEALHIVREASLGLSAAHHEGIVHRDIKPGNLLISSRGQVKVGDLGLAKPANASADSMVSLAGVAIGTPAFMPPEQWEGQATTATDVWAMGSTLYYLLSGQLAYAGESVLTLMRKIATQPFPDIRIARPDVPDDVAALLAKATAIAPADRFRDAGALADAVAALAVPAIAITDVQIDNAEQATMQSLPTRKWLDEVREQITTGAFAAGGTATGNTATSIGATNIDATPNSVSPTIAIGQAATDNAIETGPAAAMDYDPQLDASHIRQILKWGLLGFVLAMIAGGIGGFLVWDAQSSGRVPAWALLMPTVVASIVFMGPLYFLRKKWFPTKERLQAAVETLKQPKSPK